jgi:two-component system, cell cycle sensor histidine kinase and response regulator CckA
VTSNVRETILVVDDFDLVLRLVVAILEHERYHVLQAASASEALRICDDYEGTIDLLLSDVVMPGISGPQLANRVREHRPTTRIMFMSGYPDGNALILNRGWSFVRKPFLTEVLLQTVSNVLQTPVSDQGTDHFDTRRQ